MLDLLIYLDELLIKNLNSLVLNGYIDIRTYRRIKDRTLGGNVRISDRNSNGNDLKNQKDKLIGYEGKHKTCEEHYQYGSERNLGIEGRDFDRVENEIKKINTVFTLHNSLVNKMYSNNNIKKIDYKELSDGNINSGDYIEVTGCIHETSMPLYLEALIECIDCYGIDYLNSLLEKNTNSLNFNIIYKLLLSVKKTVTENGGLDLLIKNQDISLLLTINKNNFVNSGYNIFDFIQCDCKIFGKVMMIKEDDNKCISLFRKSSQEKYYESILEVIEPYIENLREKNIVLPIKPNCNVNGKVIMILPISICI